jgi:hypothetical protein
MSIRVLVADDQSMVRAGFRTRLAIAFAVVAAINESSNYMVA